MRLSVGVSNLWTPEKALIEQARRLKTVVRRMMGGDCLWGARLAYSLIDRCSERTVAYRTIEDMRDSTNRDERLYLIDQELVGALMPSLGTQALRDALDRLLNRWGQGAAGVCVREMWLSLLYSLPYQLQRPIWLKLMTATYCLPEGIPQQKFLLPHVHHAALLPDEELAAGCEVALNTLLGREWYEHAAEHLMGVIAMRVPSPRREELLLLLGRRFGSSGDHIWPATPRYARLVGGEAGAAFLRTYLDALVGTASITNYWKALESVTVLPPGTDYDQERRRLTTLFREAYLAKQGEVPPYQQAWGSDHDRSAADRFERGEHQAQSSDVLLSNGYRTQSIGCFSWSLAAVLRLGSQNWSGQGRRRVPVGWGSIMRIDNPQNRAYAFEVLAGEALKCNCADVALQARVLQHEGACPPTEELEAIANAVELHHRIPAIID